MGAIENALILVVDDDTLFLDSMNDLITRMGHRFCGTDSLKHAQEILSHQAVDLVLLDLLLPDGHGLDRIERFKTGPSQPEIVIISGDGDPDSVGTAIVKGALEFLVKPAPLQSTRLAITRALTHRKTKKNYETPSLRRSDIIGESRMLLPCFDAMARAAAGDSSILITGETGTGKELFARTVHTNSSRKNGPFVIVDCASLTETLVESTLFGHSKGAFTSADQERCGLVKAADGGTLFLDEIGEMPLSLQKTFLRVLQEKKFRPVGKTREVTSNFRLVAATNKNLSEMVESGDFRRDLLFRLCTLTVELPPLRKRCDDIPLLAEHHVKRLSSLYGLKRKFFEPGFFDMLKKCFWPGNVRELFNVIEHAFFASCHHGTIRMMDLPQKLRIEVAKSSFEETKTAKESPSSAEEPSFFLSDFFKGQEPTLKTVRNKMESAYLTELIHHTHGEIPKMLGISGLSRSHLYAMLKRHHLTALLKG